MKKLTYLSLVALFAGVVSCAGSSSETQVVEAIPTEVVNTNKNAVLKAGILTSNFIDKDSADQLIDSYRGEINESHFNYNGNRITGYTFTRGELNKILNQGSDNELFVMWGLTDYIDNTSDSNKHLNLIIAPVTNGNMDSTKEFLVSNEPSVMEYSQNKNKSDNPIDYKDLDTYSQVFHNNGVYRHLENVSQDAIIKSYTIKSSDLTDVDVQNGDSNDIFVFIPVIRPGSKTPSGSFKNKPYLSVAFGQVIGGKYEGNFIEYCDPCPSQCMNYKALFID